MIQDQTMWKLFKVSCRLLFTLIGMLLFRCESGSTKKDGNITFHGMQFKASEFNELNGQFGKTSTNAYYKSRELSHVDIGSFTALDENYAKDKDTVYYCDEYREGQNYYLTKKQIILKIQNANAASFVSLQNEYARDRHHVYFKGVPLPVKDISTFTSINSYFAKDKITVYLNRKPISGSDGSTFELMEDHFAKDKNHIYYYGYIGDGRQNIATLPADPKSFVILDYRYSKDNKSVFFLGFKIKGADPASFTLLDEGYAKDNQSVYYEERRVANANASSFEVYKENGEFGHDVSYAKDATAVFMNEHTVAQADVQSFLVLGENYGRDKQNVYYKTKIVQKAIPETFKVYPHTFGNADSEDAKNKFHEGAIVLE
jgi:hypothetical protein